MSYLRMKLVENGLLFSRSDMIGYLIFTFSVEMEGHIVSVSFANTFGVLTRIGLIFICDADSDAVASKMESGFSTPFDTETLPRIPVPRSSKERTCAWLNSTHLPRRTGPSPARHIDEFQGKPLQLSPKTPRAKRMERDGYSPVPKCCVACITLQCPPDSECSPWVYSPSVDDSRLYCNLVR